MTDEQKSTIKRFVKSMHEGQYLSVMYLIGIEVGYLIGKSKPEDDEYKTELERLRSHIVNTYYNLQNPDEVEHFAFIESYN